MQILPRKEIIQLKLKMVSGWYKLWMRVLRIKNYIMIIHKGINDFGREKKLVRSLSVRI